MFKIQSGSAEIFENLSLFLLFYTQKKPSSTPRLYFLVECLQSRANTCIASERDERDPEFRGSAPAVVEEGRGAVCLELRGEVLHQQEGVLAGR